MSLLLKVWFEGKKKKKKREKHQKRQEEQKKKKALQGACSNTVVTNLALVHFGNGIVFQKQVCMWKALVCSRSTFWKCLSMDQTDRVWVGKGPQQRYPKLASNEPRRITGKQQVFPRQTPLGRQGF